MARHVNPGSSTSAGPSPIQRDRRIVVGIGGASGAAYARRLVDELVRLGTEVHVVVSTNGMRMPHDELGLRKSDLPAGLAPSSESERANELVVMHPLDDVGASIASGSFRHDGMVIVPCSSSGLGMIAGGLGPNLLYRAAAVTLKEKRNLVICYREMPLPHIDIENMHRLSLAGAIIAPANPGWYFNPTTTEEIVDFVVARLLDLVGIDEHQVGRRWKDSDEAPTE